MSIGVGGFRNQKIYPYLMSTNLKIRKILTIFGTRPEAIKLAPVIMELSKYPQTFESIVGATGKHDKLLQQVLDVLKIS